MAKDPVQRKRARMENGPVKCWSAVYQLFPQCNGKKGADLLKYVSSFVSEKRHESFLLKSPAGASLKIGDLDDTIYRGDKGKFDAWGRFYLPKMVSMQVIGVVEGASYLCEQLVLMTCEDKSVYGYDGEKLHLVASSLKQLIDEGIQYPADQSYYLGQTYRDMVRSYI
ncbi:uncharacterized protein LOC131984737 isoform X2 [Centropristis striata]|uniref:uncharacterized protein LOC131984737 isoform X2 n=1 Tax=Centropristis striata TaxID=184440 RepID=UPI0027DF763E|nr:uncharacterized protein LOC131984737 isoform X2 [Centropristis striata]